MVLASGCASLGGGKSASAPAAPASAAASAPAAPSPPPAVAAAPAAPASAASVAKAPTTSAKPARAAVDPETLARYRGWIDEARIKHPYPDTADRMVAVMLCESKGNAAIVNKAGPYSGLFQYGTPLWKGNWNLYRSEDVLDPKAQIFATALAWSKKMQRSWGCYTKPR